MSDYIELADEAAASLASYHPDGSLDLVNRLERAVRKLARENSDLRDTLELVHDERDQANRYYSWIRPQVEALIESENRMATERDEARANLFAIHANWMESEARAFRMMTQRDEALAAFTKLRGEP